MSLIGQVLPEPRLRRYRALTPDDAAAERFYLWSQELAHATFADIASTEIVVRSAIARELGACFGSKWYRRTDVFDDETAREIGSAWGSAHLDTLVEDGVDEQTVEGKLVATLMFGTWIRLLGKGGVVGWGPTRQKRKYHEELWEPALHNAFPDVARRTVLEAGERVKYARNRIAHHEHIVWGVVIPNKQDDAGGPLVLSVREVQNEIQKLAGYVSADAAAWISASSKVPATLAACPLADTSALRL